MMSDGKGEKQNIIIYIYISPPTRLFLGVKLPLNVMSVSPAIEMLFDYIESVQVAL